MKKRTFHFVSAFVLLLAAAACAPHAHSQQSANSKPDAPLAQARTLAVAGKLGQSEAILRPFIQQNPSSADARFLLGYVLFREDKARESLAEFTAGARTRRPGPDEFTIVASDYVLLGDYTDAAKWFAEVTKEKPDDPEAWYLLGRAQYNNQQFANAIASFQHALTLRPKYVESENNLGLAWQGLNDPDDAKTAFQTAIAWQQDHPSDPQPFLNLGTLLLEQNQAGKALPYLQTAARLAPKNPKIHEQLGRAYEVTDNLTQAQHELESATTLAEDVSALHFELGRIYRREGLRDRAQQQFDICAKLNNKHPSTKTPNPFSPD
jgi:Flp pilus assembly protein TadD